MNVRLNGEVLSDDWAELYRYFGYESGYFCPSDIRGAIEALTPGEELVIEVNSVGGDVYAANEIFAALQSCQNPTRADIQSLAASAASYLVLACDRVEMRLPAQMMIHDASLWAGGNKKDLRHAADMLETTDASILSVYVHKSAGKATEEQLRALMDAETYLTAQECLDLGLIDAITGAETADEGEPLALVASVMNNTVAAMRVLPPIGELMDRRAQETAAAEEWDQNARALEVAKEKYFMG